MNLYIILKNFKIYIKTLKMLLYVSIIKCCNVNFKLL